MFVLKLISKLPFSLLYLLADCIYFVIYRLIKYRRKTVFQNIKQCFPEKTETEIKQIAKDFYRHFADLIVEILKTWSMTPEEMRQRVRIKNPEVMAEYVQNQKSAIGLTGHLGNWEWLLPICSLESQSENVMAVYKQLNNASFDKFIFDLRSRFGGKPVKMDKIFLELRKCKNQNLFSLTGLIADQAPMKKDAEYWTTFFGIESAFFGGIVKLPQVFQVPVVFISMRKIKRGFYEICFEKLTEPPYQKNDTSVLEKYSEKLEAFIRQYPSMWLWTHKRWKYEKE